MEVEEQKNNFKEFFQDYYEAKISENKRKGSYRVTIELSDLIGYNPELADDLIDNPIETLKAAEIALEDITDIKDFRLRVRGDVPGNKVRIRDLRAKNLNKFITIEGTIETKTDVGVRMTCIKFECPSCANIINVLQLTDELKEPTKCGCGRKGKFRILNRELMDVFTMRLQELSSSIKYGSNMKMISVLCNNDLTDTIIEERLIEGTRIKINGTYTEKYLIKDRKKQTQLVTYIEANYISISDETFYDIDVNKEDIEEIKKFSKRPNLIQKIAEGLFQGVYGNYKIKEALTLQAFGGVSNYEAIPNVRGDIHIALIGDAGLNKSVFLEYVSKFSPKCVLCVGKGVSAVGLSGAVIKDELSGSFVLKPGAIPLANGGIICIDELDKMKLDDRDILHEPFEQQTISISKANLPDRKMLARESGLISMNPKNGYFNDFDPIYQQIDLPPTLVNRFDLIFILKKSRDKSDEVRRKEKAKAAMMMTRSDKKKQKTLMDFHKFCRKYIAYSKQNCFPTFDDHTSTEYIPEKYAQIDYERKGTDEDGKPTFPISPRHLFIIKRIAEARRRVFLGDRVTQDDVDYAIDKLRGSLEDFAIDVQTGKLDIEYVTEGIPSKTKRLVEVFDEVYDKVEAEGVVKVDELVDELKERGFEEREIEKFIEKKHTYGDIFYSKGYTEIKRTR